MTKSGIIRTGIGGWTFDPWNDSFYPSDLPKKRQLEYASRQMTAIEVNGTYYSSQKPTTFAKWASEVPDDFVFSLKASRFCTNRKILAEAGPSVEKFLHQGIEELGSHLGPILWQFMGTKKFDAEDFEAFLGLLPKDLNGLPSGVIAVGVQAYPIRPDIRLFHGRVAVKDAQGKTGSEIEKRPADPHQVVIALFGKRASGANAGMGEDITPDGQQHRQTSQKFHVALGNRSTDQFPQRPAGTLQGMAVKLDAIRPKRLLRTVIEDPVARRVTFEKGQKRIVVIAAQADTLEPGRWRSCQMIENRCRLRPAIDIISQHHNQLSPLDRGRILADALLKFEQGFQAAMHVADGIDCRILQRIDDETWRTCALCYRQPDITHHPSPLTCAEDPKKARTNEKGQPPW